MPGARSDMLLRWASHPIKAKLAKSVGVPLPPVLARPLSPSTRFASPLLAHQSVRIITPLPQASQHLVAGIEALGGFAQVCASPTADMKASRGSGGVLGDKIVIDASALPDGTDITAFVMQQVQPLTKLLPRNSRVVMVVRQHEELRAAAGTAASPALLTTLSQRMVATGAQGFVKSLAREFGAAGTTVNLVTLPAVDASAAVSKDVAALLAAPVAFLLQPDAAYVTSQLLRASTLACTASSVAAAAAMRAGAGAPGRRVALVTGAASGIGAAACTRLAAEGYHVVAVDRVDTPAFQTFASRLHATPIVLDVTDSAAPAALAQRLRDSVPQLDVVLHCAGITRDKTLRGCKASHFDDVLKVNLKAIVQLNEALGFHASQPCSDATAARPLLSSTARMIVMSSINGIAGSPGQTNYAYTKSALMGYVSDMGTHLAPHGITANAIAPGYIATPMTDKLPWMLRQIGQRSNALSQSGLPEDVAAAAAFLASPYSQAITGQTLRVCGGSIVGR